MAALHIPVLLSEVLEVLDLHQGDCVIDATFGNGGHGFPILERTAPDGRLLAIDRDPRTIARAQAEILQRGLESRLTLFQGKFSRIKLAQNAAKFPNPNAVLFDLGISSDQLMDPSLGLSFQKDSPLDMRLDMSGELRASDIILTWTEEELIKLFCDFGEEPQARVIAHAIVEKRRSISRRPENVRSRNKERSKLLTTRTLASWVEEAVGYRRNGFRHARIHPATRIFQALRIAVNNELEELHSGLTAAYEILETGGRLAVISFHSLEDRIVKDAFRSWEKENRGLASPRRAIRPSENEILTNPRARSAKLRCFVKH